MPFVMPIIATTWEALVNCITDRTTVIYVTNSLYHSQTAAIEEKLSAGGYIPADQPGKRGVFFLLTHGEHPFDPAQHTIYDPLNIL